MSLSFLTCKMVLTLEGSFQDWKVHFKCQSGCEAQNGCRVDGSDDQRRSFYTRRRPLRSAALFPRREEGRGQGQGRESRPDQLPHCCLSEMSFHLWLYVLPIFNNP